MYISKVILKNIRGFADLNFNLARDDGSYAGWTVFTDDNGSGKSTLLKAIAVGLTGKDPARALQPDDHGLLGWYFTVSGTSESPFREFREHHPAVWKSCEAALI